MFTYYVEYLNGDGKDRELFVKANNTEAARAEAQSHPEAEQFNQDNELCFGQIDMAIREVKRDIKLCEKIEALEETQ